MAGQNEYRVKLYARILFIGSVPGQGLEVKTWTSFGSKKIEPDFILATSPTKVKVVHHNFFSSQLLPFVSFCFQANQFELKRLFFVFKA